MLIILKIYFSTKSLTKSGPWRILSFMIVGVRLTVSCQNKLIKRLKGCGFLALFLLYVYVTAKKEGSQMKNAGLVSSSGIYYSAVFPLYEGKVLFKRVNRLGVPQFRPILIESNWLDPVDCLEWELLNIKNYLFMEYMFEPEEVHLQPSFNVYTFNPLVNMHFNITIFHLDITQHYFLEKEFTEIPLDRLQSERHTNCYFDFLLKEFGI